MTLHQQIKDRIKEAMRSKDPAKLNVLRGVLASATNELVAQGKKPQEELSDQDIIKVIQKSVKQRKDSIEQFKKGGRDDLAQAEEEELEVLKEYLPEQMPKEEIKKLAEQKKAELGVEDRSKMGVLMGAMMKELKGQADGNTVKEVVEGLFS